MSRTALFETFPGRTSFDFERCRRSFNFNPLPNSRKVVSGEDAFARGLPILSDLRGPKQRPSSPTV